MRSMLYYLKYISYQKTYDRYMYCNFGSVYLFTVKRRHRRAYLYRGDKYLFFKSFKEGYTELIRLAIREAHKRDKVGYIGRICYA